MSAGASESNLGLFGGRQRPNLIGDPNTDGSDTDRVVYEGNEDARYFDSGAFANPGVGTFGNAPRTDGDARYQFRKNVDLVIAKDTTVLRQPRRTGPVRDPEPDQHGQAPRHRQQRRRLDRLRPDYAAGRVHADLAVELPLHVLAGIADQGQTGQAHSGRPVSFCELLAVACSSSLHSPCVARRAGRLVPEPRPPDPRPAMIAMANRAAPSPARPGSPQPCSFPRAPRQSQGDPRPPRS